MSFPEEDRALRAEDAAAFKDNAVAQAYSLRPPYPEALVERLADTVVASERRVVDLGCGTGDISRRLAAHVNHIDAVDFSREMLDAGMAAPGGDSHRIAWHYSRAEDFVFRGPYGLAVAAESLHWFDLPLLLERLRPALHPCARLAVVERLEASPWDDAFRQIIPRFSMSLSYRAGRDFIAEMEASRVAERGERLVFGPYPFSQSVEDYIQLQHSRSSFATHRMRPSDRDSFDEELRAILEPYAAVGLLTYQFSAAVTFLRPGSISQHRRD